MKINTLITILALVVALFAINLLVARHPARLDLTENNIYTLSDSTRTILADLDDVLTIRVYFSSDLPPALKSLNRDIDDLLAEFKGAAGRQIQVEHLDPSASLLEEQKAAMLGIPPLQINVIKRDKQEVAKIYLGMAVLYGEKQEVIPVISNVRMLEYQLAEAILKVSRKSAPEIAWWGNGGDPTTGMGFGMARELLEKLYTIQEIDPAKPEALNAESVQALVLASPEKLSAADRAAIATYLAAGGKMIALIDRWRVASGLSLTPVETNAIEMLEPYGVTLSEDLVADQSSAMAAFSGGMVTYHLPYAFWPEVRREQFDQAFLPVAELESAVFPWTTPIELSEGDLLSGKAAAIISSSPYAMAEPGKDAALDPQSANALLKRGPYQVQTIGALLKGPFAEGGDTSARLFIVGSSRWLQDRFLQQFPQNAALLQNMIDSFAMGDLLIGIRSREEASRPITILSEGAMFTLRSINIAFGPIALALIGVIVILVRRAQKRRAVYNYR